jgi:hypothetical protein
MVLCLWIIFALAAVLAFSNMGSGAQVFAAAGKAKRYALPVVYLLFLIASIHPAPKRLKRGNKAVPMPAWVWLPTVGVLVSYVGNLAIPSPRTDISGFDLIQGLALFLGFTLLARFGLRADDWPDTTRRRLVAFLLIAALVTGLFQAHGLAPFVALTVPGFFAAVGLFLRSHGGPRWPFLLLSIALGYLTLDSIRPNNVEPTSAAVLGQVAVCGAILALFLVPRALRRTTIVLAIAVGIWWFVKLNGFQLLSGNLHSSDVTIYQRSFEAKVVLKDVSNHLWTIIFGLGPGARVDLSASPDASTLLSSGRDLLAVDDVHLLSAYLLLKLGALGIVWALLLFIAMWKAALPCFGPNTPDTTWRLVLLLFVAAGAINALPAATNLLVNPLVPLFLGVLWSARSRAQDTPEPDQIPSLRREPKRATSYGQPQDGVHA